MLVDHLAELLVVATPFLHVLLAPHTKVEESFTLHAVRDLLLNGVSTDAVSQYDHIEFPGAVPRTFVGPGILAGVSYPVVRLASEVGWLKSGLDVQIAIRLVLACVSSLSIIFLSRRVRTAFGAGLARSFLLITATQFHVPFWISRTVPNMVAFPLVQIALALLITPPSNVPIKSTPKLPLAAFAIFTFVAVVLRLEITGLLIPLALEQLARGTVSFVPLITCGVVSAAASLACTVAVDSFFWQRPEGSWLWPEGSSFFFNVVEGKASEWGTSPFYTYFLLTLPKLLLLALPFAFFSLFLDRRARRIGVPAIVFIAILSGLEHKEWRFISYVVPVLNICAASGLRAIGALFASRRLRRLSLVAIVCVNLVFTLLGVVASRANYAGGSAVEKLGDRLRHGNRTGEVSVHVSPHAAMNGATNFLLYDSPGSSSSPPAWYLSPSIGSIETFPRIAYSKFESPELVTPAAFATSPDSFDYLLVDATTSEYPSAWVNEGFWKVAEEVGGFVGFGKFWRAEKIGVKTGKSVGILERVR